MFPNEQFFDKEILNSPEFQKWWEEGYHQVWKVNLSFKEYCALYHVKTEKTWEEVKKEQIRMTFKKFAAKIGLNLGEEMTKHPEAATLC